MHRDVLKCVLAAVTFGATLAFSTGASAYHEKGQEWITSSNAYTLRAREFSLGLVRWDFGILDEVTIGTLPALWFTGPWLGAPIPNGYVKVRDWVHGPVAVSVQAGFLFLDGDTLVRSASRQNDRADLFVLNTAVAATWRSRKSYSLGMSLAFSRVDLAGSSESASVDGTIVSDTFRISPFAEWRFSRVVALQLNATVLAWHREPSARVFFRPSESVTVDADLNYSDAAPNGAYAVWPALACSFRHVNFLVGAGYGYRWVPIVDVMFNRRGLVLALDFHVRF